MDRTALPSVVEPTAATATNKINDHDDDATIAEQSKCNKGASAAADIVIATHNDAASVVAEIDTVDRPSTKAADIAIVGMGYVGLPLALTFLEHSTSTSNMTVLGIDVDEKKIRNLQKGKSYIDDIPSSRVAEAVKSGRLVVSTSYEGIQHVEAVIIAVPTPLLEPSGDFDGEGSSIEDRNEPADGAGDDGMDNDAGGAEKGAEHKGRPTSSSSSPSSSSSSHPRHPEPDLSLVISATKQVAKQLSPGCQKLIVLESTTYPGTTRDVLLPILSNGGAVDDGNDEGGKDSNRNSDARSSSSLEGKEVSEGSEEAAGATGISLQIGRDFFLAFSPERVDPGNPTYNTHNTPKLVGGITPTCLTKASDLYSTAVQTVIPVSSTEVAEITKLFENIFRCVNIALVNEMAMLCDAFSASNTIKDKGNHSSSTNNNGVNRTTGTNPNHNPLDVWEVVEAAATKPFGFMSFAPGPGLGGHCIPIDPFYLSWIARHKVQFDTQFIHLAGKINADMRTYAADKIQRALRECRGKELRESKVLLLGMAYKPNVSDVRESPAVRIAELLLNGGADVSYHDALVPAVAFNTTKSGPVILKSIDLTDEAIRKSDVVAVVTEHRGVDYGNVVEKARLVVDFRNVTKGMPKLDHVWKL